MSLTYATYKTTLSTLTTIAETDTDFLAILPEVIDYAEKAIKQELQRLTTQSAHLSSPDDSR